MHKLSRRTMIAGAAAAASPVPAVAAALHAGDVEKAIQAAILSPSQPNQEVELLWSEYKALRAQHEEADAQLADARARLPRWADAGPEYINGCGERVGNESWWPEREDIPAVSDFSKGSVNVYRRIRQSPYDIMESWKRSVDLHDLGRPKQKKYRAELRAKYRASMRKVLSRVRQQRAEEERQGIPQLLDTLERVNDRRAEIETKLRDIIAEQRDLSALAAYALTYDGNTCGEFFSLVLMVLHERVAGQIKSDIAAKIEEIGLETVA